MTGAGRGEWGGAGEVVVPSASELPGRGWLVGERTAAGVASERAANATPATVAETASPEATHFAVLTARSGRELRRTVTMVTTVNPGRFGEDEEILPTLVT